MVAGRQARHNSPGTPSPPTQPVTKFAQQPQKHQIWGVSSAQGELFHAHTHDQAVLGELLHTQDATRGDFANNDTTAATDAGRHETAVTTARP